MAIETLPIFTRKLLAKDAALRAQAYVQWKRDPASVEDSVAAFLEGFETGASSAAEDDDARRRSEYYRSPEFARRLSAAFARAKDEALIRAEALPR